MTLAPRAVLVHRTTEYEELIARHGTHGQAAFFLSSRGREIDEVAGRREGSAIDGVEPQLTTDGALELQAARHPLEAPVRHCGGIHRAARDAGGSAGRPRYGLQPVRRRG